MLALSSSQQLLLLATGANTLLNLLGITLMAILSASIPCRAARVASCADRLFGGCATALLVAGVCASIDQFSPSLAVAVLALHAAATAHEAPALSSLHHLHPSLTHLHHLHLHLLPPPPPPLPHCSPPRLLRARPPRSSTHAPAAARVQAPSSASRLAAWVFRFAAVGAMLADAFWLLWFGPPRLLRNAARIDGAAAQEALAREGAFVQGFLVSAQAGGGAEAGSGEAAPLAAADAARFGDDLHFVTTVLCLVLVAITLCLSFARPGARSAVPPMR